MEGIGKETSNQIAWIRTVVQAIRVHQEPVSSQLTGISGLDEEGWRNFLSQTADDLEGTADAVWAAATSLAQDRGESSSLRNNLEASLAELDDAYEAVRETIDLFEPAQLKRLGLANSLPIQRDRMVDIARAAAEALIAANVELEHNLAGKITTKPLGERLEESVSAAAALLDEYQTNEREVEGLLIRRDQAREIARTQYQNIGSIVEALFRLAGEEELAERIRPTQHRAVGREKPEEDVVIEPTDSPIIGGPTTDDPSIDGPVPTPNNPQPNPDPASE